MTSFLVLFLQCETQRAESQHERADYEVKHHEYLSLQFLYLLLTAVCVRLNKRSNFSRHSSTFKSFEEMVGNVKVSFFFFFKQEVCSEQWSYCVGDRLFCSLDHTGQGDWQSGK